MSRSAWSIPFETAVPEYDEVLFSSGDCRKWLITKKGQISGNYGEAKSRFTFI